jgi:RNA polymerase sigma factor (sigma-70 family)
VVFTGGRQEIADDAVAEAFARALAQPSAIRNPRPWLYRTAFRIAAGELRRERRDEPQTPPRPTSPMETAEVMSALRRLSPNQRAAIVLHYYVDFPVKEIARALGISPATVKVHLFRGRRRLRALLGGEESDG